METVVVVSVIVAAVLVMASGVWVAIALIAVTRREGPARPKQDPGANRPTS